MMDKRYGKIQWGPHGERVRTSAEYWKQPIRWAKKAREAQERWAMYPLHPATPRPARPRVFCASLADVFDNQVPPEWRFDLFRLIDATPELDWLLLTKRPENILKTVDLNYTAPPNVWLGTTCEDQQRFNHRWPILREIPAAVRFISYEPAIWPLTLHTGTNLHGLHWLICGGESGAGHRPMDPEWEERIRNECRGNGIAYFFKQLAGKKPIPEGFPVVRQFPTIAA